MPARKTKRTKAKRASPSRRKTPSQRTTVRLKRSGAVVQRRPMSIHEMSAARRARVFMAVRKVMKAHGVDHDVAAIHFTPAPTSVAQNCPDGQVRRIHCTTRDDGTVVCESRCEPI